MNPVNRQILDIFIVIQKSAITFCQRREFFVIHQWKDYFDHSIKYVICFIQFSLVEFNEFNKFSENIQVEKLNLGFMLVCNITARYPFKSPIHFRTIQNTWNQSRFHVCAARKKATPQSFATDLLCI